MSGQKHSSFESRVYSLKSSDLFDNIDYIFIIPEHALLFVWQVPFSAHWGLSPLNIFSSLLKQTDMAIYQYIFFLETVEVFNILRTF